MLNICTSYYGLENCYVMLAKSLLTSISSDYNQDQGREEAAYYVRQLVKELLGVRKNINDVRRGTYRQPILDEEKKMSNVIKQEIGHWRNQYQQIK
ncbi:unnamed protein product [Arabis nemorensis]|uniref:Uncharacterized protein n=1 Tax=Arabis nemorensis TaxID=586526 RepID=A0A565B0E8_9BRAS|nr:unnamed protein product [Arabis nemorensis]